MTVNEIRPRAGKKILGASMGDCVHVAGVLSFLRLAESQGYRAEFAGTAVSPEDLAAMAKANKVDYLAVGYRLDPEAARNLIRRLKSALEKRGCSVKLLLGGTPPVAQVAREEGGFDAVFSGKEDIDEIIAYLRGKPVLKEISRYPDRLGERIEWKQPYPILRHHFGLPSVDETAEGIKRIAGSGVLDVISLGPDQNAQESFFRPEEMDHDQDGSGGTAVRSREDFEKLYAASRTGNYPLMRCYSGTRDVFRFAELLASTIKNAWAAIPLCWYNVLDGRGPRPVVQSIAEGQELMAWHAQRGIPVEVNEAHHWSLRDAPDVVAVAAAYLAAYNAKKAGVREYVAQLMFNTPPGTSPVMDLGKMLAKIKLVESLAGDDFKVYRQVRAGLASFPVDLDQAKGHLALSTTVSMAVKPHIVHVVGYCEADHLASAEEVIESCKIARGAIRLCLEGMPDLALDERVIARRERLVTDAMVLLAGIAEVHRLLMEGAIPVPKREGYFEIGPDPFADPVTLSTAIALGILDAPHLKGNPSACGEIVTSMVDGACVAIDPKTRKPIPEEIRIERILDIFRKKQAAAR
ncbi:MAG TPA: cobalamin B12-binding domain-containing protein [Firmicutes bacterium]|nr:cobalamin B12-binding domain-containing protein [Candidatus Fermentithermobacillaceae bacterium]